MKYFLIILYLICTVLGLVFFKLGKELSLSFGKNLLLTTIPYNSIIGLIFYILSFTLNLYMISKYDLSYIFPITSGLSYVGVMLASYFIFKEPLALNHIIGLLFVFLGITLINIKKAV